jgi:hypothetical protein
MDIIMLKINPKLLISEKGDKVAVQIEWKKFLEIQEYIEDLEDTLLIEDAKKESKGIRKSLINIIDDLKKEGLIN